MPQDVISPMWQDNIWNHWFFCFSLGSLLFPPLHCSQFKQQDQSTHCVRRQIIQGRKQKKRKNILAFRSKNSVFSQDSKGPGHRLIVWVEWSLRAELSLEPKMFLCGQGKGRQREGWHRGFARPWRGSPAAPTTWAPRSPQGLQSEIHDSKQGNLNSVTDFPAPVSPGSSKITAEASCLTWSRRTPGPDRSAWREQRHLKSNLGLMNDLDPDGAKDTVSSLQTSDSKGKMDSPQSQRHYKKEGKVKGAPNLAGISNGLCNRMASHEGHKVVFGKFWKSSFCTTELWTEVYTYCLHSVNAKTQAGSCWVSPPSWQRGNRGKPRFVLLPSPSASQHQDVLFRESSLHTPPPCFFEVLTSITDQPLERMGVVNTIHQENAWRSQELRSLPN